MFKRLTAITIILIIGFGACWKVIWNEPANTSRGLYTLYPVLQIYHYAQDLNGRWSSYDSLQKAWHNESRAAASAAADVSRSDGTPPSLLTAGARGVLLPSDKTIKVVAKRFTLPGKWSARNVILNLDGVYGRAVIYLNGVDGAHRIGEIEGVGGTYTLEIEPARFEYNSENILLIELRRSKLQNAQVFGSWNANGGFITGRLQLAAVPDTGIRWEDMSFAYNTEKKQILIEAGLRHYNFEAKGPWVLRGELRREGTAVAECLLPVGDGGDSVQSVTLSFAAPEPYLWSPEKPQLYELHISLSNNRGSIEGLSVPFGVSTYAETTEGGWVLNGQPFAVQGVVVTETEAARIQSENGIAAYMQELKERGVNLLYMAGRCPDESWFFAADSIGMGLWCDLPVRTTRAANLPSPETLIPLLKMAERHPSLLAWTALRGGEAGADANASYLEAVAALAAPRPVYELCGSPQAAGMGTRTLAPGAEALQGAWGQVIREGEIPSRNPWPLEGEVAVGWALALLVLEFFNLRTRNFAYNDLFAERRVRRWILQACFCRFLTLVGRLAALAAILVHLFRTLPLVVNVWVPYPWDFLRSWQSTSPYFLWGSLTLLLLGLRLLQLGVAAPAFPNAPQAVGLACWLERRYGWSWLIAVGWVWVSFFGGVPWMVLALYLGLLLVFWPLRLRDFWRLKVKYRVLWTVPATVLCCLILFLGWHWADLLYLRRFFLI